MQENTQPIICLITGANGAGKSSVSKALTLKLGRCALIKVDDLRRMEAGISLKSPVVGDEAKLQTSLATKNACALANNFNEAGLKVVIDCVTAGAGLKEYLEFFKGKRIKTFLLLPAREVLLKRFHERGGDTDELRERTEKLYAKLAAQKDSLDWQVIDSSNQTLEETTEEIFKELQR